MKSRNFTRWFLYGLPVVAGVVLWFVRRPKSESLPVVVDPGFSDESDRLRPAVTIPKLPEVVAIEARPETVVVEHARTAPVTPSVMILEPESIDEAEKLNRPVGRPAADPVSRPAATLLPHARREIAGWCLGVAAVVFMILSGWGFHWEKGQPLVLPTNGLIFLVLGAIALGGAIWLLRPQADTLPGTDEPLQTSKIRPYVAWVGFVAELIFAESNAHLIFKDLILPVHAQMALLVLGGVVTAYGLGGFAGINLRGLARSRKTWLPLVVITAVAFVLRVWDLSGAVHIMIDELHNYDGLMQLWNNPNLPVLQHLDGIAAYPHVFSYLAHWTVAVFGPDFFGMRFPSVIFGTLTIPALYLLGRALKDHNFGLLAAALLAVFPPHIHFSRTSQLMVMDPFFATLAFAFLARAMRYNRQYDYVLAGLMIGWTSYFYEGGRLLFASVFVLWLAYMLATHRPRAARRGLVALALTAFVVVLPYYFYSFSQGDTFAPRVVDQGRLGYLLRDLKELPVLDVLLTHWESALRPAISHTIYTPDSSMFYYGGYTAVLLWYMTPFFFLGLLYALYRARPLAVLLWPWLILGLLGESLVVTTDWTARFVVFFPLMMLAAAAGLRYPLEMLWPGGLDRRWGNAVLAACVVVFGFFEVSYYFGEHLPEYNVQVRQGLPDFYDAFDRASKVTGLNEVIYVTDQVVFTPVIDSIRPFRNITATYDVWKVTDGFGDKLAALPHDQTYAFAIDPGDTATLAEIQTQFPVVEQPWSSYPSVPLDRQYDLYVYKPAGA